MHRTLQDLSLLASQIASNPSRKRDVEKALTDTLKFIEKEAPRRADIRPPDVAELLTKYYLHAQYLSRALELATI